MEKGEQEEFDHPRFFILKFYIWRNYGSSKEDKGFEILDRPDASGTH